mgnify:CR=1 FL=1
MAKKTTTQNLGSRGQANLNIIAAAGQRFAPIKTDISGYMKALGNVAEVLVNAQQNALKRTEGVDLTDEIKSSEIFGQDLKDKRNEALTHIKTMRNTLPFTKKHKEAKTKYEQLKKDIESTPQFFNDVEGLQKQLDQVVVEDINNPDVQYVNISGIESDAKTNYLLAFYNKKWTSDGGMYDPDGDGPEKAFPWFDIQDGVKKIFSGEFKENGEPLYKLPKDIDLSFVKADAGKNMYNNINNFLEQTAKNARNLDVKEFERLKNTLKTNLLNAKQNDPLGFQNMLVSNNFLISENETTNFLTYYMKEVLTTDEDVPQELKEKLNALFDTYKDNPLQKQAMQTLYKAISQYDQDLGKDMDNFLDKVLSINKDIQKN